MVARRAHNPKVVGSSPAPATKKKSLSAMTGFFRLCLSCEKRNQMDTKLKGDIAEQAVVLKALKLGFEV